MQISNPTSLLKYTFISPTYAGRLHGIDISIFCLHNRPASFPRPASSTRVLGTNRSLSSNQLFYINHLRHGKFDRAALRKRGPLLERSRPLRLEQRARLLALPRSKDAPDISPPHRGRAVAHGFRLGLPPGQKVPPGSPKDLPKISQLTMVPELPQVI